MRESQLKGRARLGTLKQVNTETAAEMAQHRGTFEQLKNSEAPRVVTSFNLFQTPEPIALNMARALTLNGRKAGRVLEPSAGLGRLYRAIRKLDADAEIVCVEQSPEVFAELCRAVDGDRDAYTHRADFLTWTTAGEFDSIIMNPPFERGTDVRHVNYALEFLRPGGLLVGLCYNGVKQNRDLLPLAASWEVLPAGSFKSEGTAADVCQFIIRKPLC